MSERSFFAELQRRNVYRAAVFCGAGAWLLVQVATQVFPFFDIPNCAVRIVVVVVVVIVGFRASASLRYARTPATQCPTLVCSPRSDRIRPDLRDGVSG